MNDQYRDLKERMRRLDALLESHGAREDVGFAQALSSLHRAERRGDRSRQPSAELVGLLERAEGLSRRLG
jgi:hypothetical protein